MILYIVLRGVKKPMEPKIILKLQEIFTEKGWVTNSKAYERFVNCLNKLSLEEQEFVLEVTNNYIYFGIEKYEELVIKMFNKAYSESLLKKRKIIIVPLLKFTGDFENEMKQVKSSNLVAYIMKSTAIQYFDWLRGKNISVYNFLNDNEIKQVNEKEQVVIFVDDYIGSGKTAFNCIEAYCERGLEKENFFIMSMFIESVAKKLFTEHEIKFIDAEIKYNNIRDIYNEDFEEKERMIRQIGRKIKAPDEYFLGYGEIGALLSLIRTPNNTLPFYWSTSKGRKAPFPR